MAKLRICKTDKVKIKVSKKIATIYAVISAVFKGRPTLKVNQ